ncbi:MAG: cytochrome b/b6 domain-containing protein [Saprospiraceae bacterium]
MGMAVFVLTMIRVIAYFKDPRPEGLYPNGNWRQKLINFVHKGFYWVILWMCISGIISLFVENIIPALQANDASLLPDLTKDLSAIMLSHHIVAKFVMLFLITHLVGIFSHIFKTKENVFKRIFKG